MEQFFLSLILTSLYEIYKDDLMLTTEPSKNLCGKLNW